MSKSTIQIDRTVNAASMNSSYEVEVPLHHGWNLITNPFSAVIRWGDITATNGITANLYRYANGTYGLSAIFNPYTDYYFYNGSPNATLSVLRIPYEITYFSINPKEEIPIDWQVNVQLSSAGITDSCSWFGVASAVSGGLNKLCSPKPRAFEHIPELHFRKKAADETVRPYAADFRPSIGEVECWDLSVNGTQGEPSVIAFKGIASIPNQYSVFLIDSVRLKAVDLRVDSVYQFVQALDHLPMGIIVGSAEKIADEIKNLMPTEYSLSNNFPNPFNPSTTLYIRLPQKSEVTVRIYNILGQLVKELFDGMLDAGQYPMTWDGRNIYNQPVPSGVYYCRVNWERGKAQTVKMILLK